MEYTMWERTPLKWHKFLTYVALPLSTALSIFLLIVYVRDMVLYHWMWDETMAVLSWLDIYYAIARSVLSVVALLGCLPKRRRWYGPKCVIALLFLSAAYSMLCAILYSLFDTPQDMIYQRFDIIVSCSVTGILTFLYYKKRKRLFSLGAIQSKTCKVGSSVEAQNVLAKSNEKEPENSVELLINIQNDNESKQSNDSVILQRGKTLSFWVVIVLAVLCVICIIVSAFSFFSLQVKSEQLEEAQTLLRISEKNYDSLSERYGSIRAQKDAMQSELNFWENSAVIVTQYGEKYHTYGCQYVEGKAYWIYNVEAAIDYGYTPCSACNPPRP